MNIISYTLGFLLFVFIIISAWEPFVSAIETHSYEITGNFKWPNWPVRGIIILGSLLSAWSCAVYVLQQITLKKEDKLAGVENGGGLNE